MIAKAGTCPTGANYGNSFNQTLAAIGITDCKYFSFSQAGASDTLNSGDDESHPQQHLPGMTAYTGSLPNAIPAGRAYILKGGDVWTKASGSIPWTPFPNGTTANPNYVGFDFAWFVGGSWSRPIFDASAQAGFTAMAYIQNPHMIVDNIEFTNLRTFGGGTARMVFIGQNGGNDTVQRCYFHGWNHFPTVYPIAAAPTGAVSDSTGTVGTFTTTGATVITSGIEVMVWGVSPSTFNRTYTVTGISGNSFTVALPDAGHGGPGANATGGGGQTLPDGDNSVVIASNGGPGNSVHDNVIDGADTLAATALSGNPCGFHGTDQAVCQGMMMAIGTSSIDTIYNNVIKNVTTGINDPFNIVHDNYIGPVWLGYTGGHRNALFNSGAAQASTPAILIYNNVVTGVQDGGMGQIWLEQATQPAAGMPLYMFDNVEFKTAAGQNLNLCQLGSACGPLNIFNNTLACGSAAQGFSANCSNIGVGPPFYTVNMTNNHCIISGTTCSMPSGGGETVNESFSLVQTAAQANANTSPTFNQYNESQALPFSPVAITNSTVSTGTNNSSLCTTISGINAAAGTACLSGTTYAGVYNTTNHTVSFPATTPLVRGSAWDKGAYEFSGAAVGQVAVNWTNLHQTIDGFGAMADFNSPTYTNTMFNQLFSVTTGAGLSLVRIAVPDAAVGFFNSGNCTSAGAACYNGNTNFTNIAAAGVKIWASQIGPPAAMKTPNQIQCNVGGTTSVLSPGSYGALASWQSNFITTLASNGISLYALSVQNEPNFCPTSYEGALWTGAQLNTYITSNLGPTLTSAGQTATLIITPEDSTVNSLPTYGDPTFTGSGLAKMGIAAMHDYGVSSRPTNFTGYASAQNNNKHVWETEVYGGVSPGNTTGTAFDGSIADGLMWAQTIHNFLVNGNANAWHYYLLKNLESEGSLVDNESFYSHNDLTTPAKRLWTLGQWARFVRPGWTRIDATANPLPGIFVSAFKGTNNFAIVAVNTTATAVNNSFSLAGFPAIMNNIVTPYLTDTSNNLAQQSPVAASPSTGFTYTLPASSVTTFSGFTGVPNASNPSCVPGSGTYSLPLNITCSDSSPGAVMCYSVNGFTPATNGTNGCAVGNLYSSPIAIPTTLTLNIIAGGTGFLDSSVISYNYVVNSTPPGPVAAVPAIFARK